MPATIDDPAILEEIGAAMKDILRTGYFSVLSSIYTHSIPWAFHSKEASKNRSKVKL